ncbi:hypothetical protein [Rhodanobacter hydrolyticus]|uniref:Uncharacterized protein n=1 Tax=Rhodanobacter hydrolyticus TaxID=2250595 RepID=A0ABW8J751_9GAMM
MARIAIRLRPHFDRTRQPFRLHPRLDAAPRFGVTEWLLMEGSLRHSPPAVTGTDNESYAQTEPNKIFTGMAVNTDGSGSLSATA